MVNQTNNSRLMLLKAKLCSFQLPLIPWDWWNWLSKQVDSWLNSSPFIIICQIEYCTWRRSELMKLSNPVYILAPFRNCCFSWCRKDGYLLPFSQSLKMNSYRLTFDKTILQSGWIRGIIMIDIIKFPFTNSITHRDSSQSTSSSHIRTDEG